MTADETSVTIRKRGPGVILAAADEPVGRCLDRMAEADVGSIVVVDDERVTGILTERDVLRRWRQLSTKGFLTTSIGDIATRPVFTMRLDDLADAPREMLKRRIRHVPLVDAEGKIAGIMSMRDILHAQLAANVLPRLRPEIKKPEAPSAPLSVLHILTPTAQLGEICRRFLPATWRSQVWTSIRSIESIPEVKASAGLGRTAFMLDLDGVAHADWKSLIRRFVQMLTSDDQPSIFLVWTPGTFSDKDVDSLLEVTRKASWNAYQRPLAVPALAADLEALE